MNGTTLRNFIDGEYVPAASRRTCDLVDPTTGEVFAAAPVSDSPDVDRAHHAAARAFERWRDTTPRERQSALLKFADAVERRADELMAAESRNTGKPLFEERLNAIPAATR